MSWNPSAGKWSREEFNSSSGASTSGEYIGIAGGYVNFRPIVNSGFTYVEGWEPIVDWSFSNPLYNIENITGSFSVISGESIPGNTVTMTGSYEPIFSAGAWKIHTPQTESPEAYCFTLYTGSPSGLWSDYFTGGGQSVTIEVDVTSHVAVSGVTNLSGFLSGQSISLPPLSNQFVNQGIYIDNDAFWEYIEISPYGVRLLNHPEIAIASNMTVPRRLRVGIHEQDIHLSLDDGKTVIGFGKLDTSSTEDTSAKIAFGAPPISGNGFDLFQNSISGCVGLTQWHKINILTGEVRINTLTGVKQKYSLDPQILYTASFDPQIGISKFNYATVKYLPKEGGTTTIGVQYSGLSGWIDSAVEEVLSPYSSSHSFSLASVPVYSYPRNTTGSAANPIRFKIEYISSGFSPPPLVTELGVYSTDTDSYLDIFPNWKPCINPVKVYLGIEISNYINNNPREKPWSTFLLNAPDQTGDTTGVTEDVSGRVVSLIGTVFYGGRYKTALSNYQLLSGVAKSGSDAELYFGQSPVKNFFPNPFLDEGYVPVIGVTGYVEGKVYGELAAGLGIPTNYTGKSIVNYIKVPIERTTTTTVANTLLNRNNATQNFIQKVYIPPNTFTGTYDGTEGLEIIIPSGIVPATSAVSFDIQINEGSGVYVFASGDSSTEYNLFISRSIASSFIPVTFPLITTYSGEVRVYLGMESGASSSSRLDFDLDNITCIGYDYSPIECSGVPTYNHATGIITSVTGAKFGGSPYRTNTVFYGDFLIDSYPSQTGVLFSKLNNGTGLSIYLNNSGQIIAEYDLAEAIIASAVTDAGTGETYFGKSYLTGETYAPLGKWFNLGFCHQTHPYEKMEDLLVTGIFYPTHFASNRSYLTVQGLVVGSKDEMTNWKKYYSAGSDTAPYSTYIMDSTSKIVLMSGVLGAVDGVHLQRPPTVEAETVLSIEGARNNSPYFVPDVLFKPNVLSGNKLYPTASIDYFFTKNINIGSIYNFDGPGYTNWDHGPFKNHLLFYGNISKDPLSPYYYIGSTRLEAGGYAVAKYSSCLDRLFNSNQDLGYTTPPHTQTVSNSNQLEVIGWVKPFSTGEIFSLVEDVSNPQSGAISINITPAYKINVSRRTDFGTTPWSFTTTGISFTPEEWNALCVRFDVGSYTGVGLTKSWSVSVYGLSGNIESQSGSAVNAGFQYYGRSGNSKSSAIYIGRGADISVSDWAINPYNTTSSRTTSLDFFTGDKGGRFSTVIENSEVFTGTVKWINMFTGEMYLPASNTPSSRMFSVSSMNGYDSSPRYSPGIDLLDDEVFREVQSYQITYDESSLLNQIGSTDSPMFLGYSVPLNAINIARINTPGFSVRSSINTLDLSDSNKNNLSVYRRGAYTIAKGNGSEVSSSVSGSYKGINSGEYQNLIDVTFSGQILSKNIEVTSMSVTSPDLSYPEEAYYAYLIGRGNYGVYIPDALPHVTGITNYTTGSLVNDYTANLEKVRASLSMSLSDGTTPSFEEYPYDIVISPYCSNDLRQATMSGLDIHIDGINIDPVNDYSGLLPKGVFSVILLTPNKRPGNTERSTVWVNYPSYDFVTKEYGSTKKEIVNPIKITRETFDHETPVAGRYSLSSDSMTDQNFTMTYYGIYSGYSGVF